jgi:DegV family protein with EDD domain
MGTYKVALVTDSGCDLPDALLAEHGIRFVPLYVIWGREVLRDRVDIEPQTFYERIVYDPIHPTTSQPTPADFVEAFTAARDEGAEEAVAIALSGGMSSTYDSALQAAGEVDFPVHVVDSRANSMSQGWEVLAAARARAAGDDAAAMIRAADAVRQRLVTWLYVDTLDYLHRGGRINRAAWLIGAALRLKPQLYVDHETGKIEPGERTRTRSRALANMVQTFFKQVGEFGRLRVAVLHGNTLAEAEALAARIRREYDPAELIISMTSPVMGVHTGPGALALCGYREPVKDD